MIIRYPGAEGHVALLDFITTRGTRKPLIKASFNTSVPRVWRAHVNFIDAILGYAVLGVRRRLGARRIQVALSG